MFANRYLQNNVHQKYNVFCLVVYLRCVWNQVLVQCALKVYLQCVLVVCLRCVLTMCLHSFRIEKKKYTLHPGTTDYMER